MNGYSFPIHENTMKQITKYHRPAPLPAPPDETMKRDENTIGNKSIKQAHDDPPPPTRRRTRRDDETIEQDECGDKSSRHMTPANELEKHKKNTSRARQAQRDAQRDEKRDEGRDGVMIASK